MDFFYRYFTDANYLLLLIIIPFLILYYFLYKSVHYKNFSGFASIFHDRLLLKPSESYYFLRRLFLFIALIFLIIASSGPRFGMREREYQVRGIDIAIALDLSRSMNAIDIEPSRLERTVMLLSEFLRNIPGNRVGLVTFSGIAYVQTPLTIDHGAIRMFLDVLNTDLIPVGGTNIESALGKSISLFSEDETRHKAIVIFTDGQETIGNAKNKMRQLQDRGIRLYIIGIAGERPVPIPIRENDIIIDYIRDDEGNIVQTYLVDDALRSLANDTGGQFYRITDYSNVLSHVLEDIDKIEKREFEEIRSVDMVDRSGFFLFLSFVFLAFYLIFTYRTKTKRVDSFEFN